MKGNMLQEDKANVINASAYTPEVKKIDNHLSVPFYTIYTIKH